MPSQAVHQQESPAPHRRSTHPRGPTARREPVHHREPTTHRRPVTQRRSAHHPTAHRATNPRVRPRRQLRTQTGPRTSSGPLTAHPEDPHPEKMWNRACRWTVFQVWIASQHHQHHVRRRPQANPRAAQPIVIPIEPHPPSSSLPVPSQQYRAPWTHPEGPGHECDSTTYDSIRTRVCTDNRSVRQTEVPATCTAPPSKGNRAGGFLPNPAR